MQDQLELFPKPPKTEKIIAQAKEAIKNILELYHQPSAGELLRKLEYKYLSAHWLIGPKK